MLIQGTLDESNNVIFPTKPLVWVDDGLGGGGGGGGSVTVTNWPTTQPVSGTVAVTGTVAVSGTPTVSVSNFPATQPVSGTVAVSGTPTVSVSNFPATQPVSGTVGVSGTVAVSGPITNAQMSAITGTAAQTAVTTDPAAAGQTMLAVLRGILAEMQAQTIILEAQQLLLDDIKTNTTPAP